MMGRVNGPDQVPTEFKQFGTAVLFETTSALRPFFSRSPRCCPAAAAPPPPPPPPKKSPPAGLRHAGNAELMGGGAAVVLR